MEYVVGVDEVGRGPLAGPITVCVVICEKKIYAKLKKDNKLPPLGKDSKKLSPDERRKYAKYLDYIGVRYVIVNISNKVIDKKGISFATKKAISQGLKKLLLDCKNCKILLDGGLRAPNEFKKQMTLVKGDEKERIIAWASILAKVSRDNLMCKMSNKYPNYGLEIHKGYGTFKHREAIKKYGLTLFHRKTFCKNLI